jgi:hypothetical protein
MLNNLEQGGSSTKPGQHERVIFIDGLNLFLRNFAILNFVNESGNHIGGLAGFLPFFRFFNKSNTTNLNIYRVRRSGCLY